MCEYCLRSICPPACPNYIEKRSKLTCYICGYGIQNGDEYFINDSGDACHYDCYYRMRNILELNGFSMRIIDD